MIEALLGGLSHPLSLKIQGQLSLIPKIIEIVIPKITYLWTLTIGGNLKELSDLFRNRLETSHYLLPGWGKGG